MIGILLNGLFLPNNSPLPFLPAVPLMNRNFVIPHSAHLHFIAFLPFLVFTYCSDPGTHSVCFFLFDTITPHPIIYIFKKIIRYK